MSRGGFFNWNIQRRFPAFSRVASISQITFFKKIFENGWQNTALQKLQLAFKTIDAVSYAPINGLPQDGEVGQPRGIWLCKAHMGWDFDVRSDPQGGELDSTTILKSQEDLGMSDEWCAM